MLLITRGRHERELAALRATVEYHRGMADGWKQMALDVFKALGPRDAGASVTSGEIDQPPTVTEADATVAQLLREQRRGE